MKVAIRKELNGSIYIDKNLRDDIPYTEPPYNFTIIEVIAEDCEACDFNDDLTFNVEKYNARKQKEINQIKLAELTNWFNTTYRYKHEKYTRLIALNRLDDDGVDPNEKLLALYEEAEDVRRQIQELEEE